jgi:hypothetical protein
LSILIVAIVCGCGGHEFPMEEVHGSVTYRDRPLPRGTVVLHPVSGTPGPQASGVIEADGTFRMKTLGTFGAAVGEHRVTVDYRHELTEQEARNLVIPKLLIPSKYARVDETPLRTSVQPDQDNTLNIVLED